MRKLFLVDDDDDILLALDFWFSKKGYEVHAFSDAKSMKASLKESPPDIMLLDVNLKGDDGRLICKQIKTSGLYQFPIILFSANQLSDHYQTHCADGFVHKPFNLQELTKIIGMHVSV